MEVDAEPEFRSDFTVEYVQHSGNDEMIAHAAMVSTGKSRSTTKMPDGKLNGLLNALMSKRHGTPFEHNSITFFIEAPIFVFREWHRHRVPWSYNEASARYMKRMKPVFWMPPIDRPMVKEGKPMEPRFVPGTDDQVTETLSSLEVAYLDSWHHYSDILKSGVANEVARAALPFGLYSSMYATSNLRGVMHFLALRTHEPEAKFVSHPLIEIDQCARKVEEIATKLFPVSMRLFNENGRVAP
jgi:thymidylate synthase (FAD)